MNAAIQTLKDRADELAEIRPVIAHLLLVEAEL